MTKIINIHSGREREVIKPPDPQCTICNAEFSIDDEGGTMGYFGMLKVAFCPFCFRSIVDMVKHIIFNEKEEKE